MNNFKQKRVMSAYTLANQHNGQISINQWNKVVKRIDHLKQNISSLIKCKNSRIWRQSSVQVKKSSLRKRKSKCKIKLTERYCQCCKNTSRLKNQESNYKNIANSINFGNKCQNCKRCCCYSAQPYTKNISEVVSPIKVIQNPAIFYSKKSTNQNQSKIIQQSDKKFDNSHLNEQQTVILNHSSKQRKQLNNKSQSLSQIHDDQIPHNANILQQKLFQSQNNYHKNQTFVHFDQLKKLQALNQGLQKQNKLLQKKLFQQIKYRKIAQIKLTSTQDFIKYNQKLKIQKAKHNTNNKKNKKIEQKYKQTKSKKQNNLTPKVSQRNKQSNNHVNISTVKKICQKTQTFLKQEIQPYVNDFNLTMRSNKKIKNKKIQNSYPHFKTQETDSLSNYTEIQNQLFPKFNKHKQNLKNKRLNQSYQPFNSSITDSLSKRPKTLNLNLKNSFQNQPLINKKDENQYILLEDQLLLSPQFKKQLRKSGKQQEIAYLQQQFQELLGEIRKQDDLQKKKTIRKKMGILAQTIKQHKSELNS